MSLHDCTYGCTHFDDEIKSVQSSRQNGVLCFYNVYAVSFGDKSFVGHNVCQSYGFDPCFSLPPVNSHFFKAADSHRSMSKII